MWGALISRSDASHLRLVEWGFDEDHIRPGLHESLSPVDGCVETLDRACICPCNDLEFLIMARIDCRFDLLNHFLGADHILAREVAALLGKDLVFDLNSCGAGSFKNADRPDHVDRVPNPVSASTMMGRLTASDITDTIDATSVSVTSPMSGAPRCMFAIPAPVT